MNRKKLTRGMMVLFLLLNNIPSFAQRISGTNTAYQEGDWISYTQSRYVHSIQVAPEIVYIATEGGILRYHFYNQKWLMPFTTSNGLPENYIYVAAYDVGTNLLWCTTSSAVCVYNSDSKIWQNYYLDTFGMNVNDPVTSIGFDAFDVWLETASGRQYSSGYSFVQFSPADQQADSTVTWFGSKGFEPIRLDQYFLPNALMFIDDANNYSIQDKNLREFPLSYYLIDPWSTLWAGTAGMGLFAADVRMRQLQPLPFGLISPDVQALFLKNNELWIAGVPNTNEERNGITQWQRNPNEWNYFEPRYITRFRNPDIWSIAAAKNNIWFGTEDGLERYRIDKERWFSYSTFHGLQDNTIYAISAVDSFLWIGTEDGLDELTLFPSYKDSVSINHVTNWKDKITVYDLLIDQNLVWAGTTYGLFVYNQQTNEGGFNHEVDGPGAETVVAVDRLGDSLWVATLGTIEVYDLKHQVWRGSPARKEFANTRILDLVCSKSAVWVGTEQGLYKHQVAKGYWKQFTVQDGLLSPYIQKLIVDGDYLWIGSPQGLTRFYWNSPYRID